MKKYLFSYKNYLNLLKSIKTNGGGGQITKISMKKQIDLLFYVMISSFLLKEHMN